jgi:hypothetical protein
MRTWLYIRVIFPKRLLYKGLTQLDKQTCFNQILYIQCSAADEELCKRVTWRVFWNYKVYPFSMIYGATSIYQPKNILLCVLKVTADTYESLARRSLLRNAEDPKELDLIEAIIYILTLKPFGWSYFLLYCRADMRKGYQRIS